MTDGGRRCTWEALAQVMPFRDTFRDTLSFPHADSQSESLSSDSHQECPLSRAHPRRKVPAQAQVCDCDPDDLPVSLEGHLSGHDDHGKSVRCSCRQCQFPTWPKALIKQDPIGSSRQRKIAAQQRKEHLAR